MPCLVQAVPHLYTVQELLCDQQQTIREQPSEEEASTDPDEQHPLTPEQQRMTIGALVMRLVTTYDMEQDRPTRLVKPKGQNEKCRDKVYHPSELPKVKLLMKEFFRGFKHHKIDNDSQFMSLCGPIVLSCRTACVRSIQMVQLSTPT